MDDDLKDPYLSLDIPFHDKNFYDRLSKEIENGLKEVKNMPNGQLEKHPDASVICRYNYYQDQVINNFCNFFFLNFGLILFNSSVEHFDGFRRGK